MFGGAGLLLGKYIFRFRQSIADAYAFVIPMALAVMRLGCFGTGCCYGKVSSLPWAVRYPVNSLPHYHQFQDNLITNGDFVSLPVHPVQLYEFAGLLIVILILLRFRKSFKSAGSLMMLSMALVFTVRFVIEFFRDIHAHTFGGNMVWIFNSTQLIILPFIILFIYLIAKKKKLAASKSLCIDTSEPGLAHLFFVLLMLACAFRIFRNWFEFFEIVFFNLVLLSVTVVIIFRILVKFHNSRYRWLYLVSLVLLILLMS